MAAGRINGHGDKASADRAADAGPAHDFNNLLTVIVGNAEFLGDELAAHPKLQRLARDIAAAAEKSRLMMETLIEEEGLDHAGRKFAQPLKS